MQKVLFTLISFAAIAGCSDVSFRTNIPSGTFVRFMQSEFSIAKDTVVVLPQADGWVEVRHSTAFQRIDNGNPGAVQQKTSAFLARYEAENGACANPKTGGRYSFPKDGKTLIYNGATYTAVP